MVFTNAMRLTTNLGSLRSQSLFQCGRRISTSTSGAPSSTTAGILVGDAKLWDSNNPIRVLSAGIGLLSVCGMLFDTFYRRVTKQELYQAIDKTDAKIDRIDAKIDGLTFALLHTSQRDRLSTEAENRELRREIEMMKEKQELSHRA